MYYKAIFVSKFVRPLQINGPLQVTDDIEVEGQYKYIKRDGGNVINRQAKLDLVKAVTKTISVGAEYTWDLNKAAVNVKVNHYGVFVRRSF